MQKKLALFKDLFQPFENISILYINNGVNFLTPAIEEVVTQFNGNLKEIPFENETSAKLKATAREYEYIILADALEHCSNQYKTLKLMYKALENSGNIIILEKKCHHNTDAIKQLLEEADFVAINHIDLFDEYMMITAKKLHMWGSGL